MNYLFVCSRNQWRSRTAETIFKNNGLHQIRSSGTASSARIKINKEQVSWADIIFVMEKRHQTILLNRFQNELNNAEIVVLDIEDNYKYMNEDLIQELESSLSLYF